MSTRVVRLPTWLFPLAVVLLTLVPLLELALLVAVGRRVGLGPTLLLCAATGFLGAWLARWQGLRTWNAAQTALAEGRIPAEQVLDGALLLVGGVVLLTPGLVTDALGFALLLPPSRSLLKRTLRRWWARRTGGPDEPAIVEGEVLEAEVISEERVSR